MRIDDCGISAEWTATGRGVGVYLVAIAILPELLVSRLTVSFYVGGTSLLVVVIVMLDIIAKARETAEKTSQAPRG